MRQAFTMVELIFVILIISVLSVGAIPRFIGIKDRAKIATEISTFAALSGILFVKMEFQYEDYSDFRVNWHNYDLMNSEASGWEDRADRYREINQAHEVFSSVLKNSKNLLITGYAPISPSGENSFEELYTNPLIVRGPASNPITGVSFPKKNSRDITGKPDKNDFWIVNTSPIDISIYPHNAVVDKFKPTTIESGEIKLIDVEGTQQVYKTNIFYTGHSNVDEDEEIKFYQFSQT